MKGLKGERQLLLFEALSGDQGDDVIILPVYRETENDSDEIISLDDFLCNLKKEQILSFVQPGSDLTDTPGSSVLDICSEVPATLVVAMLNAQNNKCAAQRVVALDKAQSLVDALRP